MGKVSGKSSCICKIGIHKTKGKIWLHRGPQHGVIGTARWQQKICRKWQTIDKKVSGKNS
jgi:hypothetical protein